MDTYHPSDHYPSSSSFHSSTSVTNIMPLKISDYRPLTVPSCSQLEERDPVIPSSFTAWQESYERFGYDIAEQRMDDRSSLNFNLSPDHSSSLVSSSFVTDLDNKNFRLFDTSQLTTSSNHETRSPTIQKTELKSILKNKNKDYTPTYSQNYNQEVVNFNHSEGKSSQSSANIIPAIDFNNIEDEEKFLYEINSSSDITSLKPSANEISAESSFYERRTNEQTSWNSHLSNSVSSLDAYTSNRRPWNRESLFNENHDSKPLSSLLTFNERSAIKSEKSWSDDEDDLYSYSSINSQCVSTYLKPSVLSNDRFTPPESVQEFLSSLNQINIQPRCRELLRPSRPGEESYERESLITAMDKERELHSQSSSPTNRRKSQVSFYHRRSRNPHYRSPSPKRSRRSDELCWSPRREKLEKDAYFYSLGSKRSSYSDPRGSSHHSSSRTSMHEEYKDQSSIERSFKSYESGSSSVTSSSSAGLKKSLPPIPKVPKKNEEKTEYKCELSQLLSDQEKYNKQLISLKSLLEKTMKRGGDIVRNSRRRHSQITKDPHYLENMKLQRDVEKRIETVKKQLKEIDQKLEQNNCIITDPIDKIILNESSNLSAQEKEEQEAENKFTYIDPGNHWCSKCNEVFSKIRQYLEHLHDENHWKHLDSKNKVYKKSAKEEESSTVNTSEGKVEEKTDAKLKAKTDNNKLVVPFKGIQCLAPIKGFYCSLCKISLDDNEHAEEHMNTAFHNRNYGRMVLLNPQYEHKWNVDREKVIERIQREERRKQKEIIEKEEKVEKESRNKIQAETRRKDKLLKEKIEQEVSKARKVKDIDDKISSGHGSKEVSKGIKINLLQHKKGQERKSKASKKSNNCLEEENKVSHSESDEIEEDAEDDTLKIMGPFFPFNDPKLAKKVIVKVSSFEEEKCYKKASKERHTKSV